MSDCRQIVDRLTRYVDEVLPPEERAEIHRHLQACPPCRCAADEEQGARVVLRQRSGHLKAEALPPGLRSRCEVMARACYHRPAAGWTRQFVPAALATLLIGATGTAIVAMATERSDSLLAAQLAADHIKCFGIFPPGENGSDAGEVERMLLTRYGWNLHVPPSSEADGVRLAGARRCLYADGRIPHVMYRSHGENVSLFILEGVTRRDADVTTLGQRARIWSRGANTFVLVSSAAGKDSAGAAGYLQQEAH